jgi:hypothetical protein
MKSHFWEVGIALPLAKTVRSPVGDLDLRFSRALKECPTSQLASSSTVSSLPISYGSGALCLPTTPQPVMYSLIVVFCEAPDSSAKLLAVLHDRSIAG